MTAERTHELKVWPPYFDALADGSKPFEVRRNDRGFKVGDRLRLREWRTEAGYSGREVWRRITYVLDNDVWTMPGHVVLGLAALAAPPPEPPPLWQHAVSECNDAHRELDRLGAPTTKRVRRVRGPDGDEEVTTGLVERIRSLARPAAPPPDAMEMLKRVARRRAGGEGQ